MTRLKSTQLLVLMLITMLAAAACGRGGEEAASEEASQKPGASISARSGESDTGEDGYPLGRPRDDLDRFYGVYGDAAHPGRDFFVTQAKRPAYAEQAPPIPPGYLMIGAMWGDVAPWYMKSISETEFEQAWVPDYAPEPIEVRFEIGEEGLVVAMEFQTVFDDRGRLQRLGDLPEEWR